MRLASHKVFLSSAAGSKDGSNVKPFKPAAEERKTLCEASLSPMGDENQFSKRLGVHYTKDEEKIEKRNREKNEERLMQVTCKICYRVFATKNSRDRHVQKFHSDKLDLEETSVLEKKLEKRLNLKCPHCNRCFKYEFSREYHVERRHKEDKLEEYCCTVCKRVFKMETSLKRHMVSHEPAPFSCKYCDVKVSRRDNLKKHIERAHKLLNLNFDLIRKQEVWKCKLCSEDFGKNRLRFEEHLVLKSAYSDANSLTRHIAWKHREPVDYKCSECEASFKLKSSLTRHKKQEHG